MNEVMSNIFRQKTILLLFLACTNNLIAQQSFLPTNTDSLLPHTSHWQISGSVADKTMMAAGIFLDKAIKAATAQRIATWLQYKNKPALYHQFIQSRRELLKQLIGINASDTALDQYHVDLPDLPQVTKLEIIAEPGKMQSIAATATYGVYHIRWNVLPTINARGLLLQPIGKTKGYVIAVPDASQTPAQLAGLVPGIPVNQQYVRQLAANGIAVIIPALISRDYLFEKQDTQMTYREWIYRQAYHMGRQLVGFEVQKVIAAVNWIKTTNTSLPVAIYGYNEGGMIALYAAAIDQRIQATVVSGYFQDRSQLFNEPLYRNTWRIQSAFGDAEIASMIAPRTLVIENSQVSRWVDIIERYREQPGLYAGFPFTGYKGEINTAAATAVRREYLRVDTLLPIDYKNKYLVTGMDESSVMPGNTTTMRLLFNQFSISKPSLALQSYTSNKALAATKRSLSDLREMEATLQHLVHISEYLRNDRLLYTLAPTIKQRTWSTLQSHPYNDPTSFVKGAAAFRQEFRDEVIGHFDNALQPLQPQSRKLCDSSTWRAFEVYMDVLDDFGISGILLLPKDIKEGEKRPVVVVQHGRNGTAATSLAVGPSYYSIASKLAAQGFIVFSPQGLFRGEDQYRQLSTKANRIGKTLFSFILAQHEQLLRWLQSLPYVDAEKIAFYGKSYGGETAMRIPAILEGYCLSICSGDFGDWTRKVTDSYWQGSFMYSFEWEMPYFNMGSTYSYAEMAYLIFPRPFMVERGSDDLVQPDHWVASEYAKVSYLYDYFGLKERTAIEFFRGGHASKNDQVFEFLHRYLKWP